jgi:hypothetical protein
MKIPGTTNGRTSHVSPTRPQVLSIASLTSEGDTCQRDYL